VRRSYLVQKASQACSRVNTRASHTLRGEERKALAGAWATAGV
jgi:hypothetical protein